MAPQRSRERENCSETAANLIGTPSARFDSSHIKGPSEFCIPVAVESAINQDPRSAYESIQYELCPFPQFLQFPPFFQFPQFPPFPQFPQFRHFHHFRHLQFRRFRDGLIKWESSGVDSNRQPSLNGSRSERVEPLSARSSRVSGGWGEAGRLNSNQVPIKIGCR